MKMVWPFGMGIEVMDVPSLPMTGLDTGSTMSLAALYNGTVSVGLCYGWGNAYSRVMNATGGYLQNDD